MMSLFCARCRHWLAFRAVEPETGPGIMNPFDTVKKLLLRRREGGRGLEHDDKLQCVTVMYSGVRFFAFHSALCLKQTVIFKILFNCSPLKRDPIKYLINSVFDC